MVGLIVAFLSSLAWAAASLWVGPVTGWVDRPDNSELKVHQRAAVPLGGVGIFLGVHTALFVTDRPDTGLLIATAIVLVLGLVDDRIGLSPRLRLVVQLVAGLVLATVADVGVSGWSGVVVGTALVVFAINAVNLYDGLDGLVGSTALVTGLGIAWMTSAQFPGDGGFGLILAGSMAGFLLLNWNPAKIFLGDNGAYTVAVLIAYGILTVNSAKVAGRTGLLLHRADLTLVVWVAMGLLGVFALDLFVTLLRRRLGGRPLFEGDRSHVYDQLRDRGHSIKRIAMISSGVQAMLVAAVYVADQVIGQEPGLVFLIVVAVSALATARYQGFLHPA